MSTTVYTARRVVTMNPSRPFAEAVAVRDGRILATGPLAELETALAGTDFHVERQFESDVLLPGFIEPHLHPFLVGIYSIWMNLGVDEYTHPDGTVSAGCATKLEALRTLAAAVDGHDPGRALMAHSFDPSKHNDERISRTELDNISTTVPIFVWDYTLHAAYANTAMYQLAGVEAKPADEGFLEELDEVSPVMTAGLLTMPDKLQELMGNVGRAFTRSGVTSGAEMGTASPFVMELYKQALAHAEYPVRLTVYQGIPGMRQAGLTPDEGVQSLRQMIDELDENPELENRLCIRGIKAWVDGSPQNYSGQMDWPGYWNCAHGGHSTNLSEEEMFEWFGAFHRDGQQIKVHASGGGAVITAMDVFERLLADHPRVNHHYAIEHAMLVREAQFRRAKALGVGFSIQPLHVYYTGDRYYEDIAGPDKAHALSNASAAIRHGVDWSLHTDAPLFPLKTLDAMWAAATRETRGGRVLGENNRITIEQALQAVTINAAQILGEDHLKGSIEVGKLADFTILAEDPRDVSLDDLRDVPIRGTVVDGRVFLTA